MKLLEERFSEKNPDEAELNSIALSLKAHNLKLFNERGYKVLFDKIVVGIQRDYVEDGLMCAPLVTLNFFRTTKEAATLYNKINGGSASIWSENITESLELTKNINACNVWLNCLAVFDPQCPFQFGNGWVYGSELFVTNIWKGHLSKAFFLDNHLFNVLPNGQFKHKVIVTRFGQTFAN